MAPNQLILALLSHIERVLELNIDEVQLAELAALSILQPLAMIRYETAPKGGTAEPEK